MDRAAIRGEIGGVLVGILKEPKEIIGEFGGHVVYINPNWKTEWVVSIFSVQPIDLGVIDSIVKLLDVILGCNDCVVVVGKGLGFVGEEEVFQ